MSATFEDDELLSLDLSAPLDLNITGLDDGSSTIGTTLGKRPRNRPFTCCDFCKVRKVKCDGKQPCKFCTDREMKCEYSQRGGLKRAKNEDGSYTTSNRLSQEVSLIDSNTRQFYLDIFLRKLNPVYRILDPRVYTRRDMSALNLSRGQSFAEMMAICHTARSLGHMSLSNLLLQQSRSFAGDLIDDFSSSAAAGYLLSALYTLGGDNERASHFTSIAHSISKMSPADPVVAQLQALIRASRILEGPNRPCHYEPENRPYSHGFNYLSLVDVWETRHSEHVLHLFRMFPKHSEFMDIACRHKNVERYPINQRVEGYLPMELVEESLAILDELEGEIGTAMLTGRFPFLPTGPLNPEFTQQMIARRKRRLNSCVVFFCAALGLVDAGREYCVRLLDDLKRILSSCKAVGFLWIRVLKTVLQVGNFIHMYKIHLTDESLDYRLCLHELVDIVRPLAPLYPNCGQLFETLKQCANEPLTAARYLPRPDQHAVHEWIINRTDPLSLSAQHSRSEPRSDLATRLKALTAPPADPEGTETFLLPDILSRMMPNEAGPMGSRQDTPPESGTQAMMMLLETAYRAAEPVESFMSFMDEAHEEGSLLSTKAHLQPPFLLSTAPKPPLVFDSAATLGAASPAAQPMPSVMSLIGEEDDGSLLAGLMAHVQPRFDTTPTAPKPTLLVFDSAAILGPYTSEETGFLSAETVMPPLAPSPTIPSWDDILSNVP